jgi:hypothetical protein
MPEFISLNLRGAQWARSNQRHIAVENIDELRQVNQTCSPQKLTDRGNSRIRCELENFLGISLCGCSNQSPDEFLMHTGIMAYIHGSEFQKHKRFPMVSHSLLAEQDRTFQRQLDRNTNDHT